MAETQKVLQALLDIVSCPVCFERLRPPATCCVNGHAVCADCRDKLTKCPNCNGRFSQEKHTTLAQILEALPFSCKFKDCSELTQDIGHHEKWCGFRPTSCKRCDWTGQARLLEAHVAAGHVLQDTAEHNRHYLDKDFSWTYARVQHSQVFWDIRRHDAKKKTFYIQLIWVPNGKVTEEKFQMKIEFQSKDSSLVYTRRIKFDPSKDSEDNCITFHTDALKPYLKKVDVSYKFNILKD